MSEEIVDDDEDVVFEVFYVLIFFVYLPFFHFMSFRFSPCKISSDTIGYDTIIGDLHWKTDRQAASLI